MHAVSKSSPIPATLLFQPRAANPNARIVRAVIGVSLWLSSAFTHPALAADGSQRAPWHVDFVLDQSGSMQGPGSNDPRANALIAPLILADISVAADVVRVMPQARANQDPTPISLNVADREDFRRRVLSMRTSATGSDYQPALHEAFTDLAAAPPSRERALILLYDGDTRADSKQEPAATVHDALSSKGVFSFVLGMNKKGQAYLQSAPLMKTFESRFVRTGDDLLASFGYTFRQLINSLDNPPSGQSVPDDITVNLPALSREAWLFVLANGAVSDIQVVSAPDGAKPAVEHPAHAAWTSDIPDLNRGYRGIRLLAPKGGTWHFKATAATRNVEWILLPIYGLDMDIQSTVTAAKGSNTVPVTVTLGEDAPSGLNVTARAGVNGKASPLTCAHRSCTGSVEHEGEGATPITVEAVTENMDVSKTQSVEVRRMDMNVDCTQFQSMTVPADGSFAITHQQTGPEPEAVWAEFNGTRIDMTKTGANTWTGTSTTGSAGKKPIALHAVIAGQTFGCEAELSVRPCLSPQITLPPAPISWDACGAAPDAACQACGGGCSGVSVPVSLDGTAGYATRLGLASELPEGVTAWIDTGTGAKALTTGALVDLAAQENPHPSIRLCSSECPSIGWDRELALRVEVPEGLNCSQGEPTPGAVGSAKVGIQPHQVSFWHCNRYKMYSTMAGAFALFIVYGFVKPLKFPPQGRGKGTRPSTFGVKSFKEIGKLSPNRGIKPQASGGIWWSNQNAYFDGQFSPTKNASAVVRVQLITKAPPGATSGGVLSGGVAWISAKTKLSRSKSPWTPGAPPTKYAKDGFEDVPPIGEPLRTNHVYMIKTGTDTIAAVFTA